MPMDDAGAADPLHPSMQQTAHLIASHKRSGISIPRRRIPIQQHPDAIIRDFTRALESVVEQIRAELQPLLDALPSLMTESARELGRTDASAAARARDLLQGARTRLAGWSSSNRPSALAERFALITSTFQRVQLMRQMKAGLGVEPTLLDRNAGAIVSAWIEHTAALIADLPGSVLSTIERIVMRGLSTGRVDAPGDPIPFAPPTKRMIDQIAKRFDVGKSRAAAIARDQVRQLYASLNQGRQEEMGVRKFRWQTRRDNRVRPTHRRREGQIYDFSGRGAPAVLPGQDYGCRCSASPVIDDTMIEVAKLMGTVYRPGVRGRR